MVYEPPPLPPTLGRNITFFQATEVALLSLLLDNICPITRTWIDLLLLRLAKIGIRIPAIITSARCRIRPAGVGVGGYPE